MNKIKLKKIIAAYNPFIYSMINLEKVIKDRYVAAEFKDSLADDICDQWPEVNCTDLHNDLFESIKTGKHILELIETES